MFHFYVFIFISFNSFKFSLGQCAGSQLTFAKVAGYSPRLPNVPPLLYSSSYGTAITAECYNRCRTSEDCTGFILDYAKASCFRIPQGYFKEVLQYNPGVSYFKKVCLPLPGNCTDRAWAIEYMPGYELIGLQTTVIPNVDSKWTCSSLCLQQTIRTNQVPCYSANYHGWSKTCTLSNHDKWTDPDSFIPTTQKITDYLENECINDNSHNNGEICWHNPIEDQSTLRIDQQFINITQEQCADTCFNSVAFRCRAYTYIARIGQCSLHSDSLLINVGPTLAPSLTQTRGAIYVEAIPCINMTVTCDSKSLYVRLNKAKFTGRLFVEGKFDQCSVQGRNENSTLLTLSLSDYNKSNDCNIKKVIAYTPGLNRTMLSTVVVIQNHQQIQTVNDRIVKVSCLLSELIGNGSTTGQTENTQNLQTAFSVQQPRPQTEISGQGGNGTVLNGTFIGTSTIQASMKVIDPRTGVEPNNIQIGDPLELIITINPPNNASTVRAGHLVASSGSQQDSILLLDWSGCPPDVSVFPALMPISENVLAADFKAFRFPSSPILMLTIVLTLCPELCQPADCGNGILSYGKKKRSVPNELLPYSEEMPLQIAIIVNDPEKGVENSSLILPASFGSTTYTDNLNDSDMVCISFLAFALVILFWVLVQIIMLAICLWYVNNREKKQKNEQADQLSLRNDFQPRVTWSPETDIPSKRLRLSTPTNA